MFWSIRLGERPDGRTFRGICLAISTYLFGRGAGTNYDEAARCWCTFFWIVPYLNSGATSLISGPDLGAWPDCTLGLRNFSPRPHPSEGSDSTITNHVVSVNFFTGIVLIELYFKWHTKLFFSLIQSCMRNGHLWAKSITLTLFLQNFFWNPSKYFRSNWLLLTQ